MQRIGNVQYDKGIVMVMPVVCRVQYERDTKVPNAGTFVLQREDHTVGNLSRM